MIALQVVILLLVSQTMETYFIWYFLYVDAKIWINGILEKNRVHGVLSWILLPTGLSVFCANFLGKKCARVNFYVFRMSEFNIGESYCIMQMRWHYKSGPGVDVSIKKINLLYEVIFSTISLVEAKEFPFTFISLKGWQADDAGLLYLWVNCKKNIFNWYYFFVIHSCGPFLQIIFSNSEIVRIERVVTNHWRSCPLDSDRSLCSLWQSLARRIHHTPSPDEISNCVDNAEEVREGFNKLAKLRRCASRVSFKSKKFGPN